MKFQPTIPSLLYFERISYLTAIVGGIGVGMGLQSYFQQHQPPIIEDGISLFMLIGSAAIAYKFHQKRLELEEKKISVEQKDTPPPYLYFPARKSLDFIVQDQKDSQSK